LSLTEEQRRAVETSGSVVVVAGAGTGKTHMLTERYLHHLSEDGLSPLEVVAVTFTEKAAGELRPSLQRTSTGGAAPL
jgi:ATP-dependent helicase/nuclease subunit A